MQYLALFPFAFVFKSNYTADRIMCCISGYVNICVPRIFLSDTFKPGWGGGLYSSMHWAGGVYIPACTGQRGVS